MERATDEVRAWLGDEGSRGRHEAHDAVRDGMYQGARDREWHTEGARGERRGPADRESGWHQVRRDDWRGGRHEPWPEDHGDTTPHHGMGPQAGLRDWHGPSRDRTDAGGWHVGKGPSGYTRSDERIREDVCDRLTDDPYVDATNIEVTVQGGEVTLSGLVERREVKRRAEDLAERVSGVRDINNRLRVGTRERSDVPPAPPRS